MSAQINMNTPNSPKLNGDSIDNLPVDQDPPTHEEAAIIDQYFKQKMTTMQKIVNHTKDILVLGILYILFSLKQVDDLVVKFFPSANSHYILILIKAAAFMLIYFVIKNWYLARKQN